MLLQVTSTSFGNGRTDMQSRAATDRGWVHASWVSRTLSVNDFERSFDGLTLQVRPPEGMVSRGLLCNPLTTGDCKQSPIVGRSPAGLRPSVPGVVRAEGFAHSQGAFA
ncbi:MAG: hypothetical protein AAF637_12290 [Pseudomonadota bacterium]